MDLELRTPEDFPAFPYQPPYSIQVDLMRHLYTSLEKKAVTIVESPTGTVSTLNERPRYPIYKTCRGKRLRSSLHR